MPASTRRINIKSIALPTEHGGWGFLFEPILLAMMVAPGWVGVCYLLAATGAFLLRHPLKLVLRHRHEINRFRRYKIAAQFAAGYGLVAVVAFAAAVVMAGWKPVVPFVLVSPFMVVFLVHDAEGRARGMVPESAGPMALAATAPAIATAAGWDWAAVVGLWLVLLARSLPSIAYIRARLRLERGEPIRRTNVLAYHVVFGVGLAFLAWRDLVPVLVMAGYLILTARAMFGLSSQRRLTRTKHIGFLELAFGLLYTAVASLGYRIAV